MFTLMLSIATIMNQLILKIKRLKLIINNMLKLNTHIKNKSINSIVNQELISMSQIKSTILNITTRLVQPLMSILMKILVNIIMNTQMLSTLSIIMKIRQEYFLTLMKMRDVIPLLNTPNMKIIVLNKE